MNILSLLGVFFLVLPDVAVQPFQRFLVLHILVVVVHPHAVVAAVWIAGMRGHSGGWRWLRIRDHVAMVVIVVMVVVAVAGD